MKKRIKRVLCFLLSAAIVCGQLLPAVAAAAPTPTNYVDLQIKPEKTAYEAGEHISIGKTSDAPLFEQRAIDGNVFFDDDGRIYLYVVHYDRFGGQLWGYEMSDDLLSVKEGSGVHLAKAEGWEDRTIEGPAMLKHNGVYYLTYSGSQFESINYAVGYMTSDRPLGSFHRYAYNPVLQSTADIHGPGHHSFSYSPDGRELFIVYHCHYSLTQPMPRKLCIDRVRFLPGGSGPDVLFVLGPTATPQPLPSGS